MNAVFFVMGGIAMIWSGVRYQVVYRSIVDSFPPQFQDDLSSRYAFPVLVLCPPTPLPLQAEYVKSAAGFCVSFLFISLGFFASRNAPFGCLCLIALCVSVFETIKCWKTYKQNCDRALIQQVEEEP